MDKNTKLKLLTIASVLIDAVFLNLGFVAAFLLRFGFKLPEENFIAYLTVYPWVTLAGLLLFNVYGLYQSYKRSRAEVIASTVWAIVLLLPVAMGMAFFFRGFSFPRTVFVVALILQLIIFIPWRLWLWRLEKKAYGARRLLLIGGHKEIHITRDKIKDNKIDLFEVAGKLAAPGTIEEVKEAINKYRPEVVLIGNNLPDKLKKEILLLTLSENIPVYVIPDYYDIVLSQAKLESIGDLPVFYLEGLSLPAGMQMVKRAMDILLALIALILASPIMLVTALLIKLDSEGPVFYLQERVTENGRKFYCYKFRTMVKDAEKLTGPTLATENDPRITRVGRFLRATRIDELPQLINVLKGDMSLVGPRPERPFFVEKFTDEVPEYALRLKLKSGLTGLAQVEGKYSTSFEDKLKYDLLYAKAYTPLKDLEIILHTLKVILIKDKAS
ncbi:sugar transferase [Carboxydothermus ferrireducens]|uniref:Exopolysaccharide biosynthesis polyprenyl glycosylphosphotransferase n=1 Tax=Carboxydothermus ferrireducens DSM 11255 TaxID=1119529 RepID=A0ABX2RA57_9THEO|nr:sugar transferase [Carboxydothermus ferrireducens]NYE56953.1 exopolysaccharide biosynthesis polyprenyl glycosylphosphotransferase [Carboxydothermus ferrireducens DSM 11255]